jgi:hypothetical protein
MPLTAAMFFSLSSAREEAGKRRLAAILFT